MKVEKSNVYRCTELVCTVTEKNNGRSRKRFGNTKQIILDEECRKCVEKKMLVKDN